MKKTIRTIETIGAMTILLCGAYLLGATQAETVTETREVVKTIETVPDGYIKLSECIPLDDVACYFIDGNGYPCFELKDVGNQLDNPDNRSYTDIMEHLDNATEEYNNNFVDMRQVKDFKVNGDGMHLYYEDGTGYYWER